MTTTHAATQVQFAIEDSIRENRTVICEARQDSVEYMDLFQALEAAADDWTRNAGPAGPEDIVEVVEFWGTDEGDDWRIHLHATR